MDMCGEVGRQAKKPTGREANFCPEGTVGK